MDKCLNLSVIPQFGGTCWFNAILMIALYSQNTRKAVLRAAKYWDKSNTFLMILKSILIKYYKINYYLLIINVKMWKNVFH